MPSTWGRVALSPPRYEADSRRSAGVLELARCNREHAAKRRGHSARGGFRVLRDETRQSGHNEGGCGPRAPSAARRSLAGAAQGAVG